jgi:hypothetical protein
MTITTLHESFYKVKPDLCVLFPFGAIGCCCRPSDGGRGKRKKFESKAFTGVALGRSDNADGLVFWNPTLQRFCASANYKLDADRLLANAFPDILHDGSLNVHLCSNPQESDVEPFPIGAGVFAKIGEEPNGDALVAESRVMSVPTPLTEFYQVRVLESLEMVSCERSKLMDPEQTVGVDTAHLPSGLDAKDDEDPFSPTLPDWMRVGGKVSLLVNEKMHIGKLDLNDDNDWIFTVRGRSGQVVLEHGVYDLPCSWWNRMIDETLVVGHQCSPQMTLPVPKRATQLLDMSQPHRFTNRIPSPSAKR